MIDTTSSHRCILGKLGGGGYSSGDRSGQAVRLASVLIKCPHLQGGAKIPAMKPRFLLLPVLILNMVAIAIALHAASDQTANYTTRTLALPDHGQGNVTMDYIAYDPKTGYVWIPAINLAACGETLDACPK